MSKGSLELYHLVNNSDYIQVGRIHFLYVIFFDIKNIILSSFSRAITDM